MTVIGIILLALIVWAVIALRKSGMLDQEQQKPADYVIETETRRPTATRTVAGFMLGGPIGALIGFAARKKEHKITEIRKP